MWAKYNKDRNKCLSALEMNNRIKLQGQRKGLIEVTEEVSILVGYVRLKTKRTLHEYYN